MNERKITVAMVEAYDRKLKEDEHAAATREKYLRSVRAFAVWLDGAAVTKEAVTEWKAHLAERRQAPSTVNTALAALNGLFRFLGWEDCRARFLKVQRRIFRAPERELTRAEYDRLLAAAESTGDARLALLMESICATGIRGALCGRFDLSILVNGPALIANMGVEDEFGPEVPAERVLNAKSPLNFVLEEPTHLKYIDPTMALDNYGALEVLGGALAPGLNRPSKALEEKILNTVRAAGSVAPELERMERR